MALDVKAKRPVPPQLDAGFAERLERSLARADQDRRRAKRIARLRRIFPLLLLVGPIVAWRVMLASPDGVHLSVNIVAWLAFLLDVGVHLDTTSLSYLGLQMLPSIVGFLLFVLVTVTLLGHRRGDK